MNNTTERRKNWKYNYQWLLWWQITPYELENQVENYDSLDIFRSAKGISALFLLLSASLLAAFIIHYRYYPGLIAIIPYLILVVFIYKGKRWAMVLAMIIFTLDRAYNFIALDVGNVVSGIVNIVIWAIFMHYFWLAEEVEAERRKNIEEDVLPGE